LARSLDRRRFAPILACDRRYDHLFGDHDIPRIPLRSISTACFLDALARGAPVYDAATLRAYVKDDLALLRAVRPDVVVGDFRLSLSISARLAGIPYLAVTNAYWSPHAACDYRIADHLLVRAVGERIAESLFRRVRPFVFALHAKPLDTVRSEHGLRPLGPDVRRAYTDGDFVLYPDLEDLVPMRRLAPGHTFLGPVWWSPTIERPEWWRQVERAGPITYVSLGSSGPGHVLDPVLEALRSIDLPIVAATAERSATSCARKGTWLAPYVPGDDAVRRARLVVCNGGALGVYQALAAGVPVLAIATNMDQMLQMEGVVRLGAGEVLRSATVTVQSVRDAARRLMGDGPQAAARALASRIGAVDVAKSLEACLEAKDSASPVMNKHVTA
jgi:UDP:flavonoid glycosyltransferase YjiC (YdhE family)